MSSPSNIEAQKIVASLRDRQVIDDEEFAVLSRAVGSLNEERPTTIAISPAQSSNDKNKLDKNWIIERLNDPNCSLDEREKRVLRLRFGLDESGDIHTLEDVGAELNLTRERLRQIEARAILKLRNPSSDSGARDMLTL
jgi:RNA polymerase sigma factor (sigma-70 family)